VGKASCTNITTVLVFNGPNRAGDGQELLDVGARVKNLDAWSWSQKLEFRFHSPKNSAVRPPVEMPIFFLGKSVFRAKKGFRLIPIF